MYLILCSLYNFKYIIIINIISFILFPFVL